MKPDTSAEAVGYQYLAAPWENARRPTIVRDDPNGGDPRIIATLGRVYDEGALYALVRAASNAQAARAEAERLREALKDVASFLPDLDGASRYLRRIADMRPAMEHAATITGDDA